MYLTRRSFLGSLAAVPAAFGSLAVQSTPLPDGDAGVAQTVQSMCSLIAAGKKDPSIHELAAKILRDSGARPYDWTAQARAIFRWIQRNIRFVRDVHGTEALHAAPTIVQLGMGDCDDFTILTCSLLQTIGFDTRIVTIANHPEAPQTFSHVYPEVEIDGRWIPADGARRDARFGRSPTRVFRKRVWSVDSNDYEDVAGLQGERMRRSLGQHFSNPRATWRLQGLGYNPNALPGAYKFNINPALRRLNATPFLGTGNYGRPAMRRLRMGDDSGSGFDWSQLESQIAPIITAGTTGAANIIRASNTPGYAPASPFYSVPSGSAPFGGISPGTLAVGGLAFLAVLAMGGRH
jgi:predicted transglutaminase-like cysteine proteinase